MIKEHQQYQIKYQQYQLYQLCRSIPAPPERYPTVLAQYQQHQSDRKGDW
jgi:hypothetical protein